MKKLLWRAAHPDTSADTEPIDTSTEARLNRLIDTIDAQESKAYGAALALLRTMGDAAVPTLVESFSQSAGFRAVPVCWLLADLGGPQVLDLLYTILLYSAEPGDEQLADEVAAKLEQQGNLSTDRLIASLGDPRAHVRSRAAWYLHWGVESEARDRIVEALAPLADDPDESVRNSVAITLRQSGDRRIIGPLLTILRQATTPSHKIAVLQAFEQMPDRQVIDDCLRLLKDPDKWVRACAASVLGATGDGRALEPLLQLLIEMPSQTFASEALARLDNVSEAVDYLLEILDNAKQPMPLRARAAEILGAIGDRRARPLLTQLAHTDDDRLRFSALIGLSKLGDPESVRVLIERLANDAGWVRRGTIELFATLKNAQAVDPLIRELEKETQAVELHYLVLALRNQGSPRAVRPLRALLERTHPANTPLLRETEAAIDALKASQYD
ncbi:MAG: HEAT repeat domain-containing protein [Anaerolineae bacterium]|nr:HEAT repeat domain-containing protein [Anaerolineae bacterium]